MADKLANTTAERNILGSIITEAADFHKVSPILGENDFYRQDYREIYTLIADIVLQGKRPDLVALIEAARVKMSDKPEEWHNLTRSIFDLGNVGKCYDIEKKAEIVADYSQRRRLTAKAKELEEAAMDVGRDVGKITAALSSDIQGISSKRDKTTGDMKEAAMEFLATLERRKQGAAMGTGLADLDRIITGFEAGQLVIIAGRPGHGKSALGGTIAHNLAKKGRKILMFSMEMGKGEIAGRLISRLAGIAGSVLKRPKDMTEEQQAALTKGIEKLEALPITISTQGNLTPDEVASIATRQKRTEGLDLVIIDYLQLMSSGRKLDASRVQEISYITRSLKNLAVDLDVPILLLSQLSRANDKESRPPKLTDLRDSGSIEQDANTVILLHREREDGGGLSEKTLADVAKQRDGKTDMCNLFFVSAMGYFANYDNSVDVPL